MRGLWMARQSLKVTFGVLVLEVWRLIYIYIPGVSVTLRFSPFCRDPIFWGSRVQKKAL